MPDLSRQILAYRRAHNMSQGAFGALVGVKQPTVSRWESGAQPDPPQLEKLRKLGIGAPASSDFGGVETVPVVEAVQAGNWRATVGLPGEEQFALRLPPDPRYPGVSRQGFIVRGPSMNRVFPEGSILICVSLFALNRDPMPGEFVLVQRRDETDLFELTVKEYAIDEATGAPYLWPRSTHPEHQQPIRFPVAGEDDPTEYATVNAIVIASYRTEGR